MDMNKFTVMSQEALQQAHSRAEQMDHQEILPEHVLWAFLNQKDNIVNALLGKIGVDRGTVRTELEAAMDKIPKVKGAAEVYLSSRLRNVIKEAKKQASSLKDEYVSTEHLFLGMIKEGAGDAYRILEKYGATESSVLKALRSIRGSQRVTDPEPEGKYQALEHYTRDITELAREGKIDPVIGREDEIRRVIQVLSIFFAGTVVLKMYITA